MYEVSCDENEVNGNDAVVSHFWSRTLRCDIVAETWKCTRQSTLNRGEHLDPESLSVRVQIRD